MDPYKSKIAITSHTISVSSYFLAVSLSHNCKKPCGISRSNKSLKNKWRPLKFLELAFFLWPYLHRFWPNPYLFFGFRYLKICPFQPNTKLYTLILTEFEKVALQIRHFQENCEITSTCSKMTIHIPTYIHMYFYHVTTFC